MTKTIKRYSIIEEIHSNYTSFQSDNIKEYYGMDDFYNQSVRIKTFRLPEKEEAKRLAITLWEREIRLIRKAMGISGGHFLLQLIDAFLDYDSDKLYIISTRYGKSLEEWTNESDGLWFLQDTNSKSRKEVWMLFKSLLNGIRCLHIAKLLHRNIHPGIIFFSDESDEDIFKIGGFTWSLYLHNLNFIPKKELKQEKDYSLFQAPESFLLKKIRRFDTAILIENLEHRKLLRACLNQAKQNIRIGTDRINGQAVSSVIITAINNTLKRGVPIQVKWGREDIKFIPEVELFEI